MRKIGEAAGVTVVLLMACAAANPLPVRAAAADLIAVQNGEFQMAAVRNKDISGQVFKRLGLPNQDYCWQQCLQDARCTGARWGVLEGSTAGQCQLMSGELKFVEPHDLKTSDGQRIVVTASRKEAKGSKPSGNQSRS
jgi:hypothetical protein